MRLGGTTRFSFSEMRETPFVSPPRYSTATTLGDTMQPPSSVRLR